MSTRCEILAELMLDERMPERSGQLLIEWASRCRASGVVLPRGAWRSVELIHRLHEQAIRLGLRWYLELMSLDDASQPMMKDADGYFLRHAGQWDESCLSYLGERNVHILLSFEEDNELRLNGWDDMSPVKITTVYLYRKIRLDWQVVMTQYKHLGYGVGYSDKQPDPFSALTGIWAGATLVLKGLTLNRSLGGSAHQHDLYPHEFAQVVKRAREYESFFAKMVFAKTGERHHVGTDVPAQEMIENLELRYTESLVAARPLKTGHILTGEDFRTIPDLEGLTAGMAPQLIGKRLLYDRQPDEPLTFGMIEPWMEHERRPSSSLDISVVIRAKNEGRWLRRSLSALIHQQRQPKEIIVVDNDSSDDAVATASSFGCRVLTIHDDEFSFGRALNRGIQAANTDWVISLSAHCIPVHDRWLEAFMEERGDHVAGVYGRQEPLPDSSDFDKRDLWTTFGQERRKQHGQDYFFHNANSTIRKSVWERVPFDEELKGLEDRDWAKRVLADGWQIVYTPLASVHHYHGIHQGRNEARARRVVKVIELIQQREPATPLTK